MDRPLVSPRRLAAAAVTTLVTVSMLVVPVTPAAADQEVEMAFFRFSPATVEIETGDEVVWRNAELFEYPVLQGTHRLAADDGSFRSPDVPPRGVFANRFLRPGSFSYHCEIHETMTGTVVVTGEPVVIQPTERSVTIVEPEQEPSTWGFDPKDITVPEGTTITWRNVGTQTHTVTAEDDSFDSGNLGPGETFTVTFDDATSVRYSCTPHPWMEGIVRVAAEGNQPPPPPPEEKTQTRAGGQGGPTSVERPDRAGPATLRVAVVEPDPSRPLAWRFAPSSLRIRTGDTVVWRNEGAVVHTVTAEDGSFDSGNLAPGRTFTRRFGRAGVVRFRCTPHPWMKGTITVVAAGGADPIDQVSDDDGAVTPSVAPSPAAGSPATTGGRAPDPVAAARAPLAIGIGAFVFLIGGLLFAVTTLGRRRPRPVPRDETSEREHVPAA